MLLPGPDGGLDGLLFDDGRMDMPPDNSVNVAFLLLEGLLL